MGYMGRVITFMFNRIRKREAERVARQWTKHLRAQGIAARVAYGVAGHDPIKVYTVLPTDQYDAAERVYKAEAAFIRATHIRGIEWRVRSQMPGDAVEVRE